jgi:hypothetical protein
VCTVLLRFAPGMPWPVLVGAIRDEFVDRAWDPPAEHWPPSPAIGGRDRLAGGTWLAADRSGASVAALLNGPILPPPASGVRPSRGQLPLDAVAGKPLPADVSAYDGFHLLVATPLSVELHSWDGKALVSINVTPGDHVIVNDGLDAASDPLVPHFQPLLAATAVPPLDAESTVDSWGDWVKLLNGDGLDPGDPRALVVRRELIGKTYGSTSATLVALGAARLRYDFNASPGSSSGWYPVRR